MLRHDSHVENEKYLQHHDTYTYSSLADFALGLVSIKECCAIPVIIRNLLLLGSLLDTVGVPHSHRNEGREPKDSV